MSQHCRRYLLTKLKQILIVYTDRFSKRNLETSNVVSKIQSSYEVSFLDYEIYSQRPFLHKLITNLFVRILQYRFSEIHQFKKHLLKKKYQDEYQLNNYDRVNAWLGFPFAGSKIIYKILYSIHRNLFSFYKFAKKPDLILITSCQEGFSQYILKAAHKQKIPVLCMVNSWDHLTFRGPAYDYPNIKKYLVWGDIQKDELSKFHGVEKNRIVKTGSPQFDFFCEFKNRSTKRVELNIADDEFLIFLPAYNERHGFNEPQACEKILKYFEVSNHQFKLVIRPYPKDNTFEERFKLILQNKNVVVNEIHNDLNVDRHRFGLYLKHCDLIISGPGTAAMEAMYFGRPIIFLAMENRTEFKNINIARERYFVDHYADLVAEGGSFFCESYEEMLSAIDKTMKGSVDFSEKQKQILLRQINILDGFSSDLILNEINQVFK